jgi:hypothetical protein
VALLVVGGRVTPIRQVEEGAVDAVALSASVPRIGGGSRRRRPRSVRPCARAGVHLVAGGMGPWPGPLPHDQLVRSFEALRRWMEGVEGG